MIDFDSYLASTDDRRDFCDDCCQPWASCRCVVDPVAVAIQHVENAVEDFETAIMDAPTSDEAMRLYRLIAELEVRICGATSRALQRSNDLNRAA